MAASNTVIVGAGIIGLSTAYYLARHQQASTIHLVEVSPELFASASGYAAGFLARDWFGPGVSSLGALSFDEHKRLAKAYDGANRWGYQRSTAVSYNPGPRRENTSTRGADHLRTGESRATAAHNAQSSEMTNELTPSWLRRRAGDSMSVIGDEGSTAQLDPLRLCRFLLDECLQQGVQLHHPAKVTAVLTDTRNELSSVTIADTTSSTETDVPCTKLIIAAGAWSAQVFAELFPKTSSTLPISGLAGHSLVVRSPQWTEKMSGCHAVFTTSRAGYSPEVFSRTGGEIWIGGLNSSAIPLPQTATERVILAEAIAQLKEDADLLLGYGEEVEDGDLKIVREGLCFRPVTPYGTPIISRIDDEHLGGDIATRPNADGGVYLAAGHGPWGISLSLGTGKVLAEMVQARRTSADMSSLVMW
ncbi:hypothetical protein N0V93_009559 [Gnomoniopsis smithogilvyi]|uniref:FAD dependent oxidoreductase domain-containing protein n=1 Tax=Gnomoniopsis smithogilvyi TaxID=1191159 RepID=A0A9W8YKR0_9PEZI|nr:hypothetical protein N0V93_009559 [Gnomoniopsis smithogilvyi]